MSTQDELYQQVILEHNKKPKNYGSLEHPSHHSQGHNPLCGDQIDLYLKIDENNVVKEVLFKGHGCAISKASASMMTVATKGKSVQECRDIIDQFILLVKGEKYSDLDALGKLKIFKGIWKYPSRVKCAVLAWHAFLGAVENEKTVSTESSWS